MVDFGKRVKKSELLKPTNPSEIYSSLDRAANTGPLRPSQIDVLSQWYNVNRHSRDCIIKLHTGEGKTLTGLLALVSKLNEDQGPCLYICPNNYLADQVKLEAKTFGIPFCEFSESSQPPEDFTLGRKILITNVNKVFNGRTVFGLDNKSIDVGALVLDDSHACVDSIIRSTSIVIKRENELYDELIQLFYDDIRSQGEGSFIEIQDGESSTILPIPYWSWIDKKEQVTSIVSKHKSSDDIKFAWPLLKDCLEDCLVFVSGSYIELTPSLTPIEKFGSFYNASHRILMSATTQDDSLFIKSLALDLQSVLNPLTNPNLAWSGEKMVLIPQLISGDTSSGEILKWLLNGSEKQYGIVSLVPSFRVGEIHRGHGSVLADRHTIYSEVQRLKAGNTSLSLTLANRYDGIDLPDLSCRILILDTKPYFDSLSDRYEESCRKDGDMLNLRIAQKIEQGLGRSVRGEKDYSAIILLGGDLIQFVKSPSTKKYFSVQTMKQIEIGIDIARFAKEDSPRSSTIEVLKGLIEQLLDRNAGWKQYYSDEMNSITDASERTEYLELAKLERDAEKNLIDGEIDRACNIIDQIISGYCDTSSEKAWYLQYLARYTYKKSKVESNKIQLKAFKGNSQLLKPKEGISYKKLSFINESKMIRIKNWIGQFSSFEEMMIFVEGVLDELSFGVESEKFEAALDCIGRILGYVTERPDKSIKIGPDNLWLGSDSNYLMFECKSEVKLSRSYITKTESGQMNNHCGWFEEVYGPVACKKIMIVPVNVLGKNANFTHDIQIMTKSKLGALKNNIKGFLKEFSNYDLSELSDTKVSESLQVHSLTEKCLMTKYADMWQKYS